MSPRTPTIVLSAAYVLRFGTPNPRAQQQRDVPLPLWKQMVVEWETNRRCEACS